MKYEIKDLERVLLLVVFIALELIVRYYVSEIVANSLWPNITHVTNGQAVTIITVLSMISFVVLCILHYLLLLAIARLPLFRASVRRAAWATLVCPAAVIACTYAIPPPTSWFVPYIPLVVPVIAANWELFRKPVSAD